MVTIEAVSFSDFLLAFAQVRKDTYKPLIFFFKFDMI